MASQFPHLAPRPPGYPPLTPEERPHATPRERKARAACTPCRDRKSKCDAQRPSCEACTSRGTPCVYDIEPNTTRYTSMKKRFGSLEGEHADLLELFHMLKHRPKADACSILDRIRAGDDFRDTLAFIKEGDLLSETRLLTSGRTNASLLPSPRSRVEGFMNITHPIAYPPLAPVSDPAAGLGAQRTSLMEVSPEEVEEYTGHLAKKARSLGGPRKCVDDRLLRIKASRWTNVTHDDSTVVNLIALYLSWEHCTFRIFDEDYFVDQLVGGKTDYCSSLLVNAICAIATLNFKAMDPRSEDLSRRFFQEARRQWRAEKANPQLLHIPVSILLHLWCVSNMLEQQGVKYLAHGIRLAQGFELFNQRTGRDLDSIGPTRKVRKGRDIVAWGIFNWQAVRSFLEQTKPRQLHHPDMSILQELSESSEDQAMWDPYPLIRDDQNHHRGQSLRVMSELCVHLNEYMILRTKLAPLKDESVEFENAKLLCNKLLRWADGLPPEFMRGETSLPVVLDMHFFYHGCIVYIFRPFAGDEPGLKTVTRDLIEASVSQLQRLLFVKRYRYGGPPLVSTVAGPIRVLASYLLQKWADGKDRTAESEFYLLLCMATMDQIGQSFPVLHVILRDLLKGAKDGDMQLPEPIEAIYQKVCRVLGNNEGTDRAQKGDPKRFELEFTDPEKSHKEALKDAVTQLRISEREDKERHEEGHEEEKSEAKDDENGKDSL